MDEDCFVRPRAVALAAALLLAACRSPAPPARQAPPPGPAAVTTPQEQPDTTPPADVSHGEAPIGGPEAEPAPRLAKLEPAERTRLHRVRLEIEHETVSIAPGVSYAAWTFGGKVPGPVQHVRQGDTVDFTLVNEANIPHSMDFHAAEIAPSKYYVNVMPGDSLHYESDSARTTFTLAGRTDTLRFDLAPAARALAGSAAAEPAWNDSAFVVPASGLRYRGLLALRSVYRYDTNALAGWSGQLLLAPR